MDFHVRIHTFIGNWGSSASIYCRNSCRNSVNVTAGCDDKILMVDRSVHLPKSLLVPIWQNAQSKLLSKFHLKRASARQGAVSSLIELVNNTSERLLLVKTPVREWRLLLKVSGWTKTVVNKHIVNPPEYRARGATYPHWPFFANNFWILFIIGFCFLG